MKSMVRKKEIHDSLHGETKVQDRRSGRTGRYVLGGIITVLTAAGLVEYFSYKGKEQEPITGEAFRITKVDSDSARAKDYISGPDTGKVDTKREITAPKKEIVVTSEAYEQIKKEMRAQILREKKDLEEQVNSATSEANLANQKLRDLYDRAPLEMKEFAYTFSQRKDGTYSWTKERLPSDMPLDVRLQIVQRNYAEIKELGETIPGFDDRKELFEYKEAVFARTSTPTTYGVSYVDESGKEGYLEHFVGVQENE